jgi:hypothetical protein
MSKLSDTQLVILGAAAQRADLSVLPLPDSLKLKGGALHKVMDSMRNRGLIRVLGTDGRPERVVITSEGMAAIGIEQDGDEAPAGATEPDTAPTSAGTDLALGDAQAAAETDSAAEPAKRKASRTAKAKSAPAAGKPEGQPTGKPAPRAGTKQAQMIEMLKRPEGATVEQIAAATGWQHHTIRGAISGALKKKLGLTVETTRTREVGPNKTGAKGSSTTYRARTCTNRCAALGNENSPPGTRTGCHAHALRASRALHLVMDAVKRSRYSIRSRPHQPFARLGADRRRARSSSWLAADYSLGAPGGSRLLVSLGSTRISARRAPDASVVSSKR